MTQNGHEHVIETIHSLSEAARSLPLFQTLGLQGPHLALALEETKSQLSR